MEFSTDYVTKDSFIHRLDPRIKLLSVMFMLISYIQLNTWAGFVVAIVSIVMIGTLAKLPWLYLLKAIRPVIIILLFTFLYHFIFSGATYFSLEGLFIGLRYVVRILCMVVLAVMLTATTKPMILALGLETMLRPLEKLRIPVAQWSLMITIALRFLPLIMEEWKRIQVSQQARGIVPHSLTQKMMLSMKMIVPLLLSLVTRADHLTMAIEARAFGKGQNRTHFHTLSIKKREYLYFLFPISISFIILFVV
ncbi:energy-coupling factor transporter transmembrane protein EcfT [Paenibacillus sediminis]|uniref:Energy-coupling factor transport system permease protein n=1 Tax=Paenibacillus sediminis TaxID=664909 RepID=A0ABS4H6C9_9BACL|nr:energy-coupling factor transporter transmembrane protein EcfT [Paenibacillus sediminis]MBP1937630.1 energy-coupling factor transport system permease protein [Paenibacillus sediminis]